MAVRTPGLSGAMLPAIRDGSSLNQALDLGYRQVLVERGSLLAMLGSLVTAARHGIAAHLDDAPVGPGVFEAQFLADRSW